MTLKATWFKLPCWDLYMTRNDHLVDIRRERYTIIKNQRGNAACGASFYSKLSIATDAAVRIVILSRIHAHVQLSHMWVKQQFFLQQPQCRSR